MSVSPYLDETGGGGMLPLRQDADSAAPHGDSLAPQSLKTGVSSNFSPASCDSACCFAGSCDESSSRASLLLSRVLVCIPTYNEVRNIKELLEQILALYEGLQILVIDDNSTDGTREILHAMVREHERVHILERAGKLGLGSAYIAAFMWGLERGFMYFIQMDADFSHHPRYLKQTLQNLSCFDVVINSRNILGGGVRGWGLFRRLLSGFGSLYARLCLGVRIMDFTGGFNAYSKSVLCGIGLSDIGSNGYCFQIEMKYRAFRTGARIIELPIVFDDRVEGASKMSRSIIFEALWRTPALRYVLRHSRHQSSVHKA